MSRNADHREHEGKVIDGTMGDDVIRGTNGGDTISTMDGDDIIYGRGGDDIINAHGVFDNDADQVFGGRGNDTITLGLGADTVDGGKGDDDITLSAQIPALPFVAHDEADTVLFNYGHGKGFGDDTLRDVQEGDALVLLDKSGQTDNLDDLAAQTRLVDVGENAYRIEWLDGDQSITLHLNNDYLNYNMPPESQVNWDDFTSLQDLETVIDFRFDYDFA